MRIHLPLHPHHFEQNAVDGPSSSPLVHIGGDLVLIELQGQLSWEGEKSNGVLGVLGLDRPDKPTLHLGEHHLLHGKISTLQKPYAVIRRVYGDTKGLNDTLTGDADEEEDEAEQDVTPNKKRKEKLTANGAEDEEDEGPLFPPEPSATPMGKAMPSSSSPIYPPSAPRDYSSELDPSSPARWEGDDLEQDDEDDDDNGAKGATRRELEDDRKREAAKRKRRKETVERARHYEVVGVVRKKVVFALRPEPIVTATVLPD